ncbi:molybdenum cofactor guanylyltransferase [Pengzhenrongella sicca]|uniref:NTP transferase domain-containing protein n=1 Tax=Pengzhenrongella sicca TaxID=2819238 RepID=A0A8A4ZHX8_9MICO|nr:NTP transferase domain-containing protein [Pengzhenrongella sicca]QTE31670.1 NTP transferase domain-containing protein [Pengzhenrongella sicca]
MQNAGDPHGGSADPGAHGLDPSGPFGPFGPFDLSDPIGAFDAVILAGGRATRLGGQSKPMVLVGGRRLIDHALDAAAGARRTVVVGPSGLATPPVLTAQEDPPWGGPVAGVDAGLRALDQAATRDGRAALVLLLACDVPAAHLLVARLVAAARAAVADGLDGAQVVDADGRHQPLLGVYRRALLDRSLAELAASVGVRDAALRRLLAGARLRAVPDDADDAADADTWAEVGRLDAKHTHATDSSAPHPGPAAP